MSKPNRRPRAFETKFRRMIIVRPSIKTGREMSGYISDYVDVPVITTRGEWTLMDMLSDNSIRSVLDTYNALKGKERQYS